MGEALGGRVWLVTGASSGFGREIARAALRRGDRVAATARVTEALADLAAEAPERVPAVRLDVTDPEGVRRAVEETVGRFGRIDVRSSTTRAAARSGR